MAPIKRPMSPLMKNTADVPLQGLNALGAFPEAVRSVMSDIRSGADDILNSHQASLMNMGSNQLEREKARNEELKEKLAAAEAKAGQNHATAGAT